MRAGIFASARVASGAWTPASLSGLGVWLDAADAATFTYSSGSVVSEWRDKSANARHFSQGTVANQPSRTGSIGSGTGVTFDGSDDFLGYDGTTIVSQPFTIAMVVKPATYATNANLVDVAISGGRVLIEAAIGTRWRIFAGSVRDVTSPNPASGTSYAVVARFNGATSELRVNSVTTGTGNAGSNPLLPVAPSTTLYLGRGQGAYMACTIGELVVASGAVSGSDLSSLESYLMTKWGI